MNDNFKTWKNDINKIYSVLELEKSIVGVKLIKTKKEYDLREAITLSKPISYCQMVRAASNGNVLKAADESFMCRSGARVFGINMSDPQNGKGEKWSRLGLYKNAEISQTVRNNLTYSTEEQYGILLGPIEKLEIIPDIVLITANPYNCMRIVQGYAYHYGMPNSINMIGNQAICLECTARPYVVQDMNVSLLCIGTRHRANWTDNEMAIGLPIKQFHNVVDGLLQTVNIMESNENKKRIEKKLKDNNIYYRTRFNYNYYMDC